MSFSKGEFLYEGKAKKIWHVDGHKDLTWIEFKDSLTAFNGEKSGSFAGKGQVNFAISNLIFKYLAAYGVETHTKEVLATGAVICEKLDIIPLEVVVRNRLAGSTAKRLGFSEGQRLDTALVEFYYKKDELGDPFISDDQALLLKAATSAELLELKTKARAVNDLLKVFFLEAGIDLIDFKLEFGRKKDGQIILGDEVSPDTCRLWDLKTEEKLDKDRFRRDLGKVEESYREVKRRIYETWESRL